MQKILQLDERLVWLIKDLGASVTGTGMTAGTAVAGDVGGGEEGWINGVSLLKRGSQCQGDFRFLFFFLLFSSSICLRIPHLFQACRAITRLFVFPPTKFLTYFAPGLGRGRFWRGVVGSRSPTRSLAAHAGWQPCGRLAVR